MSVVLALIFSAAYAFAGALECDLHPNSFNPALDSHPPHTQGKVDLNGDGVDDFFYLAGEPGGPVATCLFFGAKTAKGPTLSLTHRDGKFLDVIGDFAETGRPEILIPENLDKCGPNNGLAHIPTRLDPEIAKAFAAWTNGMQSLLYTPKTRPATASLYLLNPVHIYAYEGTKKVDVTASAKQFIDLKKKVLRETLKNPGLPADCATALRYGLRRLEQYDEHWTPVNVGLTAEECISKTKLNMGKIPVNVVRFNEDCTKVFVTQGVPKIDIVNATITGMMGIAGICTESVNSEIMLSFSDGVEATIKDLSALNPGRKIEVDTRADGLRVSFAVRVLHSDLNFGDAKVWPDGTGENKRGAVYVKGSANAKLTWTSTPTCPRLPMLTGYRTDASTKQRLIDLIKQENEMTLKFP